MCQGPGFRFLATNRLCGFVCEKFHIRLDIYHLRATLMFGYETNNRCLTFLSFSLTSSTVSPLPFRPCVAPPCPSYQERPPVPASALAPQQHHPHLEEPNIIISREIFIHPRTHLNTHMKMKTKTKQAGNSRHGNENPKKSQSRNKNVQNAHPPSPSQLIYSAKL